MPWIGGAVLPPLNGDVAAILFFAVRMVAGDRLYVDLTDVNPPLIFLLNLPAAWVAAKLGLAPSVMFTLQVLLLAALSIGLCCHLLRPIWRGPIAWTGPWLLAFVLIVLPWREFGQREHLMVIFALPWMALAAVRLRGRLPGIAAAAGIAGFGAIGLLIKPYFLVIAVALEMMLALRLGRRRWLARPEPLVLLALALVYATVVVTRFPAYLDVVAPAALRHYAASGIGTAVGRVLWAPERWVIPVGLLLLAGPALRRPEPAVAWCLGVGGLIAALLQGKGWPYHLVPAWSGLALCGGALMLERLGQVRPAIVAGLAVIVALWFAHSHPPFAAAAGYAGSQEDRLAACVGANARGEPVLWLADNVWPRYPAMLYGGAKPAMADMDLWLLGSLYRGRLGPYPPLDQQGADEAALFQRILAALRRRPALVVIEPVPLDFIAYLRRDPEFGRLWAGYQELVPIGSIRLFRREAEGAHPPVPLGAIRADACQDETRCRSRSMAAS